MQTVTFSATTIPLPPSPLDPDVERVLLYELTDEANNEGWRIYQLANGSYTFEIAAYGIVLLSEHHASFADASTRVDRWYGDRFIAKAA